MTKSNGVKIELDKNYFYGKKVLVMGLGVHGGGVETVKFLIKQEAKSIIITDLRSAQQLKSSLAALKKYPRASTKIEYILGRHRKSDFAKVDVVIKNPGVPPTSPYLEFVKKRNIPIISDVEIFFSLCKADIIGITGTRGKSTTAALISTILTQAIRQNGKIYEPKSRTEKNKVFLAGNIRKSVLSILPKITQRSLVILELSSFQLEGLANIKISPHIAVITNILNDHLNWHGSLANYIKAKENIFRFQRKGDYLFVNPNDSTLKKMVTTARSKVIKPSLKTNLRFIVDKQLGRHYRTAAALAVAVAKHFGIEEKIIKKSMQNFKGLEGRQEVIGKVKGITIVNDTTSTIPEATIAAIIRFREYAKPHHKLLLICGGTDKKLNFKEFVKKVKMYTDVLILLPGTATDKINRLLKKNPPAEKPIIAAVHSMKEAVQKAFFYAKRRDWIILSPGATSFGMFLNEFDRGEQFVKEIKNNI